MSTPNIRAKERSGFGGKYSLSPAGPYHPPFLIVSAKSLTKGHPCSKYAHCRLLTSHIHYKVGVVVSPSRGHSNKVITEL